MTTPTTSTIEAELRYIQKEHPGYLEYLLPLLEEGKIDGSAYYGYGDCGCFYGHLAEYKHTYGIEVSCPARAVLVGDRWKGTPIEKLIEYVEPGEIPATNDNLRTLKDAILEVLGKEHQE